MKSESCWRVWYVYVRIGGKHVASKLKQFSFHVRTSGQRVTGSSQ